MTDTPLPSEFRDFLVKSGLHDGMTPLPAVPLPGGVSSDIWCIDLADGPICVKRALPKLKVAADWFAPIERNVFEVRWMQTANNAVPGATPAILAHDAAAGMFAMTFLEPNAHTIWKSALLGGHTDAPFAAAVGETLASIHMATLDDPETAQHFATDQIFHAIRLEPYLVATARAHPDVAPALIDLVKVTARSQIALVHGDVSPKNILMGPAGPVFLDAECAWYGDPAFDLAFCLNHFLLKCVYRPNISDAYLTDFLSMTRSYMAAIANCDHAQHIETRAARLLPGLFLARVDGKSPVEYITKELDKDRIRDTAKALLSNPILHLEDVPVAWRRELDR